MLRQTSSNTGNTGELSQSDIAAARPVQTCQIRTGDGGGVCNVFLII